MGNPNHHLLPLCVWVWVGVVPTLGWTTLHRLPLPSTGGSNRRGTETEETSRTDSEEKQTSVERMEGQLDDAELRLDRRVWKEWSDSGDKQKLDRQASVEKAKRVETRPAEQRWWEEMYKGRHVSAVYSLSSSLP